MISVIPIDFLGQGALLEPADRKLHDMAVDYCARKLQGGSELNLAKFQKVWVAVETESSAYQKIMGITGFVWRIDIPVFRVTGKHPEYSTQMFIERMRSFFQDNGARGQEVFLHLSSKETPEQRCGKWEESLKAVGAVPADRYLVKI